MLERYRQLLRECDRLLDLPGADRMPAYHAKVREMDALWPLMTKHERENTKLFARSLYEQRIR